MSDPIVLHSDRGNNAPLLLSRSRLHPGCKQLFFPPEVKIRESGILNQFHFQFQGQTKVSKRVMTLHALAPHSSSHLSARWDYCWSLRWPLSPRLLGLSPRPWVFTKGGISFWWVRIGNVNYEFVKRLEGKEYSQRYVYRGPTSSVLYFSVQPSYSCWMVRRIL